MDLNERQYLCCYWDLLIPLRHRLMSNGDGSSAEVRVWIYASPEPKRWSHVYRWAAVSLLLLGFLMPLLHRWMSAGDGSSKGVRAWVCASSEAPRVSHVSQ